MPFNSSFALFIKHVRSVDMRMSAQLVSFVNDDLFGQFAEDNGDCELSELLAMETLGRVQVRTFIPELSYTAHRLASNYIVNTPANEKLLMLHKGKI